MTNIKLTYDYTLNSIKVVNESVDKINTKLGLVLTLSGILVNFGKDLPGYNLVITKGLTYLCLSCYLLKLGAYILIIAAISFALWGLSPAIGGKIILPAQLLEDEWNLAEEENYLTALVNYLENETLLVLNKFRDVKAGRLALAIRSISSAVILLGLDEIITISIPVLQKL
ncbi:hypothetical protein [Chamaesiphon sp. OTE_75_metabat_556]|uniref:hypothetical protein n=1 Tax=Chamaesiphon sp. OTE_75_metabat_556 TaxID=2964692 RepID=UPI00286BBBB9|nr:hypothetical protein [Chamaesiphon sp. OTE_75_metabat_556]